MSFRGSRRISRVLVANRGEIALRIMRACRELGIESIAVYGEAEESAPHVRYADEAYRLPTGPGLVYLDGEAMLAIARTARADAVHPGYGFLAENAGFARDVAGAGIVFIGPPADAIASMGDKVAARKIAVAAGLTPVPGTQEPVATIEAATEAAALIGYPVAVKAVGGGGGRGFRVAQREADLAEAFRGSSGEAERYFANPLVYLERYLEHPRHIEVQVFADQHGAVVSLGERDCSIQRRHQKLVEESPSPAVGEALRARLSQATVDLARSVGYTGAGTVEYLLNAAGEFFFLEMNTRIQVEHTVTEMVTGIDLVREQILVAQGEPLSFSPADTMPNGWAIECRINAEDAGRDFAPTPGAIVAYREPVGFGIRVDGAVAAGDAILPQYDSLIAKLIAWGRTRDEAVARMSRALGDFHIEGPPTTLPFHRNLMTHPAFVEGQVSTTFLVDHPDVLPIPAPPVEPNREASDTAPPMHVLVEVDGRRFDTVIHGLAPSLPTSAEGTRKRSAGARSARPAAAVASGDAMTSPIQGTVIRVAVVNGDKVEAGDLVCVIEAMKMENELVAHKSGAVAGLSVDTGGTVTVGQVVAIIVEP